MPEFVLDHGDTEGATWFKSLDYFTRGYVEAMFFTETGTGDDGELQEASVSELAPCSRERIIADCKRYQGRYEALLDLACACGDYDSEAAGRDFWYTRNGHGGGFWCRDELGADVEDTALVPALSETIILGDALAATCGGRSAFGEVSVYRGDDGLIYLM